LDRVLVPEEVLLAYGWPRAVAEAHTQVHVPAMDDLVGETMALQPLAMVMLAIVIAANSNETQRRSSAVPSRARA
jgi:hypothetical protein